MFWYLLILIVVFLLVYWRCAVARVHKYEWLELLSAGSWSSDVDLGRQMQQRKGGKLVIIGGLHSAMEQLQEEGLVQVAGVDRLSCPIGAIARGVVQQRYRLTCRGALFLENNR